jgi:hypothetical protein
LKANVAIRFCTFVNNTATNDDGNDVYANFTSDFFGNPNNINNDCSYSFPPQLVALGVFFFFSFSLLVLLFFVCFFFFFFLQVVFFLLFYKVFGG